MIDVNDFIYKNDNEYMCNLYEKLAEIIHIRHKDTEDIFLEYMLTFDDNIIDVYKMGKKEREWKIDMDKSLTEYGY